MKTFKLEQLLTITTGLRLVADMKEMYVLISYMMGFDIFTHETPSAFEFIKPHILSQYPDLESVHIQRITESNYIEVMSALRKKYGEKFLLNPILYVDAIKFRKDEFEKISHKAVFKIIDEDESHT